MAVGGKVKGITIEFDGDTTKLGRAMTKINAEAKSVDKALRDVNRALKFNPGNAELLAQKQQLLAQKVSQTKQRLDALRKAQQQLDADPSVEKDSQEYMELRREIIKTESQLKNLNKEQRKLGNAKLTALGNQLKTVGDQMKNVGQNMTQYVTLPIAALGAGAVMSFKQIDAGYDTMIKKTGATGEAAEAMKDIIDELATTIPTDFETAGAAVGEVNTRFGATGKELKTLSGQFIKFAQLNNTDVSTSIDLVQQAMDAFGMEASDAGTMLDILNKVGQNTGISVDQLAASMVTNSAALQSMGLDASQAAQFLGEMEVAGIDSSQMMTGLKKALSKAAKEGKPLDQALGEIQDALVNAKDDTEAMNLASELFGSKAGPAIATACRNGVIDFNDLGTAVEDAGGSVSDTFEETQDPLDQFQTTLNEVKLTGAEIGSTLLEMLQPVLEKIASFMKRIKEVWDGMSPGMKKVVIIVLAIVAAIGPLLVILGTLISTLGMLMIFGPIMLAMLGPFLPIILAIVGAIIAVIAIVTHWSQICEWFKKVWQKFTSAIKTLWEKVQQFLIKAWEVLKKTAKVVWEVIKTLIVGPIKIAWTIIKTVWKAVKEFLTTTWNSIKEKAAAVWSTIKEKIVDPIKKAWEKVKEIVGKIKSKCADTWSDIKSKAKEVWDGIKNAITEPIKKAKETVKEVVDKLKSFFPLSIGKIFSGMKLPHFKLSKGEKPYGIGGKGSLPKFSVDWYAKGGIFNNPNIIGIGEAGPEAVVPLDTLWKKMDQIATAAASGGEGIQINVYATPGMDVNAVAEAVKDKLIRIEKQRREAWA